MEQAGKARANGESKSLKAAVYHEYGPPEVLKIEDVEKPVPKKDEVLVRVRVTTVCAADWRLRKADPSPIIRMMNGLTRPKKINILGMEFAGTIEKVGKKVKQFREGGQVFGATGFKFGAYAEYVCLPPKGLAVKPDNVTFEEAAAIPFGGISALHFLRKARIRAGQKVLIYGASGSVGTAAVQLAKHFGAHVTGVCSTTNLELVKSLGADQVIDYTKEKFWKAGRIYDIVFDTVGKGGFWRGMRSLKRGGHFVWAVSPPSWILGGIWASLTGAGKAGGGMARSNTGDLDFLKDLTAAGKIRTVIDRRYPLEEIAEAHRYVEAGHKKGNVIITIGQ